MAFIVNDLVWFKRKGSTPYVTGDPINPSTPVLKELGGRGNPVVARASQAQSGLSDVQGVPTIKFNEFPVPLGSDDSSDATTDPIEGEHLGVREKSLTNPMAPGAVETDDIFDGPTSANLFNPSLDADGSPIDEGRTEDEDRVNTIRDINPNFPTGRPASSGAAKASGDVINQSGHQEFVKETIDLKDLEKVVGRRLPSSLEGPGRVIQVVTVTRKGNSPDGTKVNVGDKLYWVNWGSSAASNPSRSKHNNRFRTQLHAEPDLVAAP